MSSGTTTTRAYDGSGRRRDAEQRRRRVVDAARQLFVDQGYGATSIDEIASAAGVSAPTVYAAFGSKAGVLAKVVDVAIGGDHEDIALLDRPEFAEALAHPDAAARFRALATLGRRLNERAAELVVLVRSVAGTDPAVAELVRTMRANARTDIARLVQLLADSGVRFALPLPRAVDVLVHLSAEEGWMTLVVEGGWPPDDYEAWLADAMWRLTARAG